eukprot:10561008-Heterocapsa_arctica.AAC.1
MRGRSSGGEPGSPGTTRPRHRKAGSDPGARHGLAGCRYWARHGHHSRRWKWWAGTAGRAA